MTVRELIDRLSQISEMDLEAEVVVDVDAKSAFFGYPEVASIELRNGILFLKGEENDS